MKIPLHWKRYLRDIIHSVGYDIRKVNKGEHYLTCLPYPYKTFAPWFEPWFDQIYAQIKNKTIVTQDRAYVIYQCVSQMLHIDANMAECGVYRGGTAYLIADTLKKAGKSDITLYAFDTFSGTPSQVHEETDGHAEGDFSDTSTHAVSEYVKPFPFVKIMPGQIPSTFDGLHAEHFSFVHVDVDLYQTTQDILEFFYHKLVPGGIIIFDDYGFADYEKAERLAVDEFFNNKLEVPIVLHTGQAMVIKLPK